MRILTRLIVCAATAIVLSAILFYFADTWFGENESVIRAGHQLLFEARRTEVLRVRAQMMAHSVSAKSDVIDQLIAGRLNLRQAIVQFRNANELVENIDLEILPPYQTPTDPEGVGRQVVVWTRNAVASLPREKAQRRLAELEREYRTLFHGAEPPKDAGVIPMDDTSSGRT